MHQRRIDAVVVLPEHLHCLMTLPIGDADYSTRWGLIKGNFSRGIAAGERISTNAVRCGKTAMS